VGKIDVLDGGIDVSAIGMGVADGVGSASDCEQPVSNMVVQQIIAPNNESGVLFR
jgi:hypothetical protein